MLSFFFFFFQHHKFSFFCLPVGLADTFLFAFGDNELSPLVAAAPCSRFQTCRAAALRESDWNNIAETVNEAIWENKLAVVVAPAKWQVLAGLLRNDSSSLRQILWWDCFNRNVDAERQHFNIGNILRSHLPLEVVTFGGWVLISTMQPIRWLLNAKYVIFWRKALFFTLGHVPLAKSVQFKSKCKYI